MGVLSLVVRSLSVELLHGLYFGGRVGVVAVILESGGVHVALLREDSLIRRVLSLQLEVVGRLIGMKLTIKLSL